MAAMIEDLHVEEFRVLRTLLACEEPASAYRLSARLDPTRGSQGPDPRRAGQTWVEFILGRLCAMEIKGWVYRTLASQSGIHSHTKWDLTYDARQAICGDEERRIHARRELLSSEHPDATHPPLARFPIISK